MTTDRVYHHSQFQNISCPKLTDQITVEAWVRSDDERTEVLQALVSKWSPLNSFDTFAAYDASQTDGLSAIGYFGAVFDGRYVYFVPEQQANLDTHGIVLRYDTQAVFDDPQSYSAYDAAGTGELDTRGYYGAAFDGTHVYFVPRQLNQHQYHSHVLRHDTRLDFKDANAWDAFDVGEEHSSQSAAFDGRYLYFCPGYEGDPGLENRNSSQVIRYDTQKEFKDRASYSTYDVGRVGGLGASCFDGWAFDGRHVYFIPLQDSVVVRCNLQGDFQDEGSWQAFDATQAGMGMCVGAVFDGQYLYFVPYTNAVVVRYDTTRDFVDPASWESYDADHTQGLRTNGNDGGFFDGRYVYFVPFVYSVEEGHKFHSNYLRYDTQGKFNAPASWNAHDASNASGIYSVGYNAGAFDGRYFYAAPWRHGPGRGPGVSGIHGTVLRYDTLGTQGSFSLRYCDYGHNGGLNAAVPGPSFLINTNRGVLSVATHRPLQPGCHHLAGVYDGKTIKLFIDGELAAHRTGSGQIQANDEPVTIGQIHGGLGYFRGLIENVQISSVARRDEWFKKG